MTLGALVGEPTYAADVNLLLPTTYTKSANEAKASSTTFANDSELTAIPLTNGTWEIDIMLYWFFATAGATGIKTLWTFSGTWNALIRSISGPGSSNTGGPSVVTPMSSYGQRENVSVPYGGAAGTSYYFSRETSRTVVVTAPGNFSLQWAQIVSSANAVTVAGQSTVTVRQLA